MDFHPVAIPESLGRVEIPESACRVDLHQVAIPESLRRAGNVMESISTPCRFGPFPVSGIQLLCKGTRDAKLELPNAVCFGRTLETSVRCMQHPQYQPASSCEEMMWAQERIHFRLEAIRAMYLNVATVARTRS